MGERISETLKHAIRVVREQNPDLTPPEVCEALRERRWQIDEAAVVDYLEGSLARGKARLAREQAAKVLWRGIDLQALPQMLRNDVQLLSDERGPADPVSPERRGGPSWSAARTSIMRALRDEMEATRERFDSSRVKLSSGVVQGQTPNGLRVRYEMETDLPLADGAHVSLEAGPLTFDAEILQLSGRLLTLWVAGHAHPPGEVNLVNDASFLLQLRHRYLSEIESNECFDARSALSLLAVDTPLPVDDAGVPASEGQELAVEQERFVRLAQRGGVTWLWGPPGTGKTTTLAHLLERLRLSNLRVLFVSNTNAAVDTALDRFLDVSAIDEPGEVLRLGEPVLDSLRQRNGPAVTLDAIADSLGVPAGRHLRDCIRDINRARRELGRVNLILRDPMAAARRGLFGEPGDDLFDLKQRITAERLDDRQESLRTTLGELADRKQALVSLIDELRQEAVRRARAVFATVHRAYLRDLRGERFDVVVIDEASMVSTDLAVVAAGLCSGHVVVAGDFRQLGPIALSESEEAKVWLKASIFERSGIAKRVIAGDSPERLVALRVQHRMRAEISDLIGRRFYPEVGLKDASSIFERSDELPVPGFGALTLIDTSELRPWRGRRGGKYSLYNPIHAQVVESILARCRPDSTFGAVAPFAAQASLLRALVDDPSGRLAASTVHRFQGGERDVMVWDMTEGRAGGSPPNQWFKDTLVSDEGSRLVNVALSRARDQLFVIADMDRVRSLPEHAVVRRVLDSLSPRSIPARLLLFDDGESAVLRKGPAPVHPLDLLVDDSEAWVTIWTSSPPDRLPSDAHDRLRAAVRRGVAVYIRSGVPGLANHRRSLEELQRLGCSVQLVRPCWENVAFTSSTIITSSGGLISPRPAQPWVVSRQVNLAGTAARLAHRMGDVDPATRVRDPLCERGHPRLVEVDVVQHRRNQCEFCRDDAGERMRSGRSRARSAATQRPVCGSCGQPYDDITARCGC